MARKRNKNANRGAQWQSAQMNVNYYTFYYELLQQLFCSSMKWTIPEYRRSVGVRKRT